MKWVPVRDCTAFINSYLLNHVKNLLARPARISEADGIPKVETSSVHAVLAALASARRASNNGNTNNSNNNSDNSNNSNNTNNNMNNKKKNSNSNSRPNLPSYTPPHKHNSSLPSEHSGLARV